MLPRPMLWVLSRTIFVDGVLIHVVDIVLAYVAHKRILGLEKAFPLKQKVSK